MKLREKKKKLGLAIALRPRKGEAPTKYGGKLAGASVTYPLGASKGGLV